MSDESAATTPRGRRTRAWHVALLATGVLLAALLLLWDWNWFKGPVERRVSAGTGRPFEIAGPLEVDLGRVVVIRVHGLSLANARWSLAPKMAHADMLRLEVPFWPLLQGERTLRRVDVVRPALLLERNRHGVANWRFRRDADPAPRAGGWSFGEIRVHDGRLDVRDVPLGTDLRLTVDSADPEPGAASVRLLARGTGRYRGHPFRLDGRADSPLALLERKDAKFRVDFSARAGTTRARASGAIDVPFNPARFAVDLQLSGNDLADLYPLIGLALPPTPPYRIAGEFVRNARVLTLRGLEGRVGDSDVAGFVSVDLSGDKPFMRGDLVSKRLDFDDLGGLVGLPPSTREGESASPEQREESNRRKASPRLLPDKPYDLRKLAAMNADVRLRAGAIDAGKWPLESMNTSVHLQDSVLRLDPMDFGFAGGRIAGEVALDATDAHIDADARLALHGVDLEKLMPTMQPPNMGQLSGSVVLNGNGNSVADMLATSDGEVQLAMGKGRFSNLLLELAGLDVAESLKFLLGKDKTVKLRCAYGDFTVDDGVADARSLVFDTTDTVMFGEGKVNLDREALALEVRPEPKDFSAVALRGPLRIGGTFKDPKFRPQAKSLLARAAAAAALAAITPPAALLALFETGPGENVDCFTGKKDGGKKQETEKKKGGGNSRPR